MIVNGVMVACGAVFGVLGRAAFSGFIDREKKQAFPLATFTINMIGCFVLGIVAALPLSPRLLLMLETGLIGTFTTFSTFNMENLRLMHEKKYFLLFGYACGTCFFGMLLMYAGLAIGRLIA